LVMQAAGIGLFLLTGQTIISLIETLAPSGEKIPVDINKATQIATLTYMSSPNNRGFLDATVQIGFGLELNDGSYSSRNSTTLHLLPGARGEVSLTLRVPVSVLSTYSDAKGYLGIYTNVRTLGSLAGIEYDALAEGG